MTAPGRTHAEDGDRWVPPELAPLFEAMMGAGDGEGPYNHTVTPVPLVEPDRGAWRLVRLVTFGRYPRRHTTWTVPRHFTVEATAGAEPVWSVPADDSPGPPLVIQVRQVRRRRARRREARQ